MSLALVWLVAYLVICYCLLFPYLRVVVLPSSRVTVRKALKAQCKTGHYLLAWVLVNRRPAAEARLLHPFRPRFPPKTSLFYPGMKPSTQLPLASPKASVASHSPKSAREPAHHTSRRARHSMSPRRSNASSRVVKGSPRAHAVEGAMKACKLDDACDDAVANAAVGGDGGAAAEFMRHMADAEMCCCSGKWHALK